MDNFPEVDIPVVTVVYLYPGMPQNDVEKRILLRRSAGGRLPTWRADVRKDAGEPSMTRQLTPLGSPGN